MPKMSRTKLSPGALLATVLLAACGSSTGPASNSVAFQVATRAAAATPGAALVGTTYTATNGDQITFESVSIVLHKIELGLTTAPACDPAVEHDCEELKAGPVTLDLPLNGGAQTEFAVTVPDGSYDKVEFKVAPDPATGYSIHVTGSYTPSGGSTSTFDINSPFTSDLEAEQEHEFSAPITIPDPSGGSAAITLFVDLSKWFANQAGDGFVDPLTANHGGPNEGLVKENIKNSLDAFEDEDHDGRDDHGGN
jgi:hypothetical protein